MLTPVVVHGDQYDQTSHPRLGDVVTWELWWGASYPDTYNQLEPDWSLTARVCPTDAAPTTRLGGTEPDITEQPCVGSHGAVQFHISLPVPVPETITVTGALSVTVGTPLPSQRMRRPWGEVDPDSLTTGTVRRLRVVSIAFALRPTRHPGWHANAPVPGTEWVYELAEPPEQLRWYDLADNDFGYVRRSELLLVNLET